MARFTIRASRLLITTAFLFTSASVLAAPTNEELDQRMQRLERNMEMMLELMQKGGTSAAPTTPTAEVPAGPGALTLDVFALPPSEQCCGKSPAVEAVTGRPNASTVVPFEGEFRYDAFNADERLARFSKSDANIALRWEGVLRITGDGDHQFVASLSTIEQSRFGQCIAKMSLNDKEILKVLKDPPYEQNENTYFGEGTVKLVSGLYKFQFLLNCTRYSRNEDVKFNGVKVTIDVASPGERATKPLLPSLLSVE
jgi:hypothetical protein